MNEVFRKIAQKISRIVGSVWAFFAAVLLIILWLGSGPILQYSDTWQLTINTLTTIITFIMVFIIQNTQNRDSKAVHLKLDELIRAMRGARAKLLDIDEMSDAEVESIHQEFLVLSQRYQEEIQKRKSKKERPAKFVE